jgi:predicted NUDIX family NTP pyrophosphohydrolase
MPKLSAGLLLFRRKNQQIEILLVHPGGPFWVRQDAGAWSVPKGMATPGEPLMRAAEREFNEETGFMVPAGDRLDLGTVNYGGKKVQVWAIESDADASAIVSNKLTMQWPPNSGKIIEFPECDKAEWFDTATAKIKIVKGQMPFVDRLAERAV